MMTSARSQLITIVIPVYNRADTIGRTLASIDAQTMQPATLVLVDNASRDASLSILNQWAATHECVTVATQPRPGAPAARNRGLEEVRTPYVMFFDSDDVMLPGHVEEFDRALRDNPGIDIVGRDIVTRFLDGSERRLYFKAGPDAMFHHMFRGSLSTARFVARTELVRAVGGWDESLKGWDDFELGVRLLLTRPTLLDIGGKPSVIALQTEESLTGLSFTAHPERWEPSLEIIRELAVKSGDPEMVRWADARAMVLAAQYAREGSHDLARRLYDKTIARTDAPRRMALLYHHNRIFGRLTWPLARILL